MNNVKKTLSRPHIVTRRYAEFCAAISGLNETFPDQRIETVLENMSEEVELCVSRMASIFQDPKSKLIFLINNYDMLLSILSTHKKSDDSSSSVYRFDAALRAVESEFVAQQVKPILSGLKETTKVRRCLTLSPNLNCRLTEPNLESFFSNTNFTAGNNEQKRFRRKNCSNRQKVQSKLEK